MFLRYCIYVMCLVFFPVFTVQAQSIKKLKAEADEFFKNKKFSIALEKYRSIQHSRPNDMDIRLKIGACSYFTNKSEQAKKYLHFILANDKNPDPNAYFYLGMTYHAELNFKEAVKFYKYYLRNIKSNHENRAWIKDEIRRCAEGFRIVAKSQLAIVENLGENVNSKGDDFAPILSPNFDDKIYFSSSRRGNEGGARKSNGEKDNVYGAFRTDMFSTQIINGEWTATTPMNPSLNSYDNDIALGFDQGGSILYYFKSPGLFAGEILVDTFQANREQTKKIPTRFVSPMIVENGDGDPQFFNDTILLFSSNRSGGFGGKDLYISIFSKGNWTPAKNLGPLVNSAYDEVSPFLCEDGRTLFFSSNNLKSMGGQDIFKTVFDDIEERWSKPENLGYPINSAGDDAYFKLSRDGYKGYYSSNRLDGKGQRDIYVAYFKSQNRSQLAKSIPLVFSEVRAYKVRNQNTISITMETPNSGKGTISTISAPEFPEEAITEHEFQPLFYNKDGQILNYKNTNELNKVARLLIKYPQLKLVLTSNSEGGSPINFDMYFSIKKAEEAAEYLIENGVNPKNIIVKGCGANYPIAKLQSESGYNLQASNLNRRIDVDILNITGLPIRIKSDYPVINENLKAEQWPYYRTAIQGLSYKVQIAAIKQMYNGSILTAYPDAVVESDGGSEYYRYTVGLYQTFSSADELRKDLIRQGVTDAFVVPYVGGVRVNRDDSKIYSAAYPDLLNFIENSN